VLCRRKNDVDKKHVSTYDMGSAWLLQYENPYYRLEERVVKHWISNVFRRYEVYTFYYLLLLRTTSSSFSKAIFGDSDRRPDDTRVNRTKK
jgi:hypothetical protein